MESELIDNNSLDFSEYLNPEVDLDGLWKDDSDYNDSIPDFVSMEQSYFIPTAAAQQQLMDSIPNTDVSNESYTAQLGHPFDEADSFPFPTQEAPMQTIESPDTAPSTSRSPDTSSQTNDSPSTISTTSPEPSPQPTTKAKTPKKRGRKPRTIKNKAEEDDIRKKFLERNRVAAAKCRERKRQDNDRMQQRFHALKEKNEELKWDVEYLKDYIRFLKEQAGLHVDVNCLDDKKAMAALGRRDKKLATRQRNSIGGLMDMDGMIFESEDDGVGVGVKGERQISVDSGVADLSTPTQGMEVNSFGF